MELVPTLSLCCWLWEKEDRFEWHYENRSQTGIFDWYFPKRKSGSDWYFLLFRAEQGLLFPAHPSVK